MNFNGKILVDPKPKNIEIFNDTFLITPNKKEASDILNHPISKDNLMSSAKELSKKLNTNVIITLGEGVLFFMIKNKTRFLEFIQNQNNYMMFLVQVTLILQQ